ncbi:MAG TPA: hypothetical protein PLX04_03000 [Caldisericia bacterium]|nr:hypothetical protein [Caldisericia bacterium]HOR47445.1 hypothetical protein [Caldisericia bacterium]HOU07939.1 hypothetical protein [Caldisericia bacterium]HPL89207.1 hypothetical protein [Caldisericia bacterium]HQG58971.1 hypothetical protein [Caldisericia bacterium]
MKNVFWIILGVLSVSVVLVVGFVFDLLGWMLYFVFGLVIIGIYWLTTGRKQQ